MVSRHSRRNLRPRSARPTRLICFAPLSCGAEFGLLEEPLSRAREAGVPVRVITTTYIGGTEREALDRLVRDFGAEVKVQYDAARTRLHAKAWLFRRVTGFDTAYVGSSNLSTSALLDGVEWNVRLSKQATPSLLQKFEATFDSYSNIPRLRALRPGHRSRSTRRRAHRSPRRPPQRPRHPLDLRPRGTAVWLSAGDPRRDQRRATSSTTATGTSSSQRPAPARPSLRPSTIGGSAPTASTAPPVRRSPDGRSSTSLSAPTVTCSGTATSASATSAALARSAGSTCSHVSRL